jgi:hypothetical protein
VARTDWATWHRGYEDPRSTLSQRLVVVQRAIGDVLRARDGTDVRAVSICAGDGRDLLGAISREPDCGRISARLVEQDSRLVQRARDTVEQAGLDSIDVVACDAAVTDAYVGAVPADLVLVCGVFGNVSDGDVARIIGAMPQLCARRASVIWTRHRRRPDLTPRIRAWFHEAGFVERIFESPGAGSWSVGVHEFRGIPRQLRTNETLFTFVR